MSLDFHRRQARQLLRWHRERNYSVGSRIRVLPRYRNLSDTEALALRFPLAEAQEIVALEHGYESWPVMRQAALRGLLPERESVREPSEPRVAAAVPILFVCNVQAAAAFWADVLGFDIDFLHGHPAFYGGVSRDGVRLHLRFVHEPAFASGIIEREKLLAAFVTVSDAKALFAEYVDAGVTFGQRLQKEPWGGFGFSVLDGDGNYIYFGE